MKVDLLIIGGGINGCAIARDAAGRGLSVALCEMHDLASATSSWSSKLIHGGIRYLENYEFKLVRESLQEREVMMRSAPFLIHPLPFILPYEKHLRSPLLLRAGLFLYDHLAKRQSIPGSSKVTFKADNPENALNNQFKFGFQYYDCQTDDARLTLLNALDAHQHGAHIFTYTHCTQLTHQHNLWLATLEDQLDQRQFNIEANAVINATGPWVDQFNTMAGIHTQSHVELVQGSHIVVPKLYTGNHAYILQNQDKRIVFAIPYLEQFTLIGTTDVAFKGDPGNVHITDNEIDYLCELMNHYFKKPVQKSEIIWSYAGVRPLYHDNSGTLAKTTREYHLELSTDSCPPYLSVIGGKITTARVLAEDTLSQLKPYFNAMQPAWTKDAYLPGGDLDSDWQTFVTKLQTTYSWLPQQQCHRYACAYGTHSTDLIGDANCLEDLGQYFGADLYEAEILYWIKNEWAQTPEDMLWRRSKLALFLTVDQIHAVTQYLEV